MYILHSAEEEIDGEVLIQLVEEGRSEHLQWLGVKIIKDELAFRRMVKEKVSSGAQTLPTSTSGTATDRKQKKKMKSIS